ncbi:unnamed protein product [Mytilus coruscus]|uniref:LRRNT domain-containing protein n=1 Tax=Mytilus coruscus TaxID=42192 RepID=A0A6J8AKB6_MYTCO|nr:unnamed protein product [Mytilus coruscus]
MSTVIATCWKAKQCKTLENYHTPKTNQARHCLTLVVAQLHSLMNCLRPFNLHRRRSAISTIAANAYEDLVSLESLNSETNTISSLPGGLFSKNITPRTVNLNRNNISSLPGGLFSSNINLRKVLPMNLFSSMKNVTRLDLEDNSLTSVPAQLFSSNINLFELDRSDNNLSSLPPGLLSSNIKLDKIKLEKNRLSSLPPGLLSLGRNQLLCCNMTDLFEWAALQTKATLYGACTDFGIVTNIEEFNISNCTIPVDGQWGSWTTTSCSMTCGNGMIYRNRTCNNPSPSDGGIECQGVDKESSVCNLGDCPGGEWKKARKLKRTSHHRLLKNIMK